MKNFILLFILTSTFVSCQKENKQSEPEYITTHTINWMQDLVVQHPDKHISLKNICMPRAHDAGIYILNNCFGGNACNTQTQNRDMTSMLESGIRVFDLRPVLKDNKYWSYHATGCEGFGCEGDLFENILQQSKDYLDQHNELLIFELSHFCNTNPEDAVFLDLLNNTLQDRIYKESSSASDTPFVNRALSDIVNESTGGKVVLVFEGIAAENKSMGYFGLNYIPIVGSFANTPNFSEMKENQKQKFENFSNTSDQIFKISWTLTLNNSMALLCTNPNQNPMSIEDISKEASNQLENSLNEWKSDLVINKNKIPNIISVDFASTRVTEQCIAISNFSLE